MLDPFAGTGALGVEALSRGAESAVFVEQSKRVAGRLRENVADLGLEARSRILHTTARRALPRLAAEGTCFDLVLLDPPYAAGLLDETLAALAAGGLLAPGATLIAEAPRRAPPGPVAGLVREDARSYGETVVVRYLFSPPGPGVPEGRSSTR